MSLQSRPSGPHCGCTTPHTAAQTGRCCAAGQATGQRQQQRGTSAAARARSRQQRRGYCSHQGGEPLPARSRFRLLQGALWHPDHLAAQLWRCSSRAGWTGVACGALRGNGQDSHRLVIADQDPSSRQPAFRRHTSCTDHFTWRLHATCTWQAARGGPWATGWRGGALPASAQHRTGPRIGPMGGCLDCGDVHAGWERCQTETEEQCGDMDGRAWPACSIPVGADEPSHELRPLYRSTDLDIWVTDRRVKMAANYHKERVKPVPKESARSGTEWGNLNSAVLPAAARLN